MAHEERIGSRTLRGMFWAYSSYIGGRLLVLVSTAILARLLTPKDFGVVALALIFMAFLETVKDLGLSQALVASREDVTERANTVFVSSIVLGAALSLVVAAISPLAALFFDEPRLVQLLPVLGLNFLIRSLGSTHYALAQKWLAFRARTLAEFADVVVRGLTGIALALAGAGVWSLVLGYVVGTAVLTVSLWVLVPWRPALRFRRRYLPDLLRFGGAVTGVDLISAVIGNVDYVFVGKILGPASLGLYTLAYRLPELVIMNLSTTAGQVLFPALTNVARSALGHAYLVAFRYTLMISLPLAASMAVLADPLVLAAFGPKWHGAVAPMQVLTIFAFGVTVGIPAGVAYKSVGRADVLLKLAVPRAALLVGSVALLANRGIVAVAGCQAAVAGLFSIIGLVLASRLLQVGPHRLLGAIWPPLVASAAMAGVLFVLERAITPPWPTLVASGVAGAAVYLGMLWLLARDALRDLWLKLRPSGTPPVSELTVARETDVIA
jgi:O-antigen/teichoic acid export membrane protein